MIWIEEGHHAIAAVDEKTVRTACAQTLERGGHTSVTTNNLHSRPYGADSCLSCHLTVKGWALEPDTMPEGVPHDPEPPAEVRRAMSAADRRASIEGRSKPVSMPGGRAGAPARGSRSRRAPEPEPPDDLVFPPEGGQSVGAATVDGAMVVVPTRQPREVERDEAAAADIDINAG